MNKIWRWVLVVMFLTGCASEIDPSHPAIVRDELFSVEPRVNGTYTIWLMHDDIAAYCAMDETIGETALKAMHEKSAIVVINYTKGASIRLDDQGCTAEGAKYIYKITSIEVLAP